MPKEEYNERVEAALSLVATAKEEGGEKSEFKLQEAPGKEKPAPLKGDRLTKEEEGGG